MGLSPAMPRSGNGPLFYGLRTLPRSVQYHLSLWTQGLPSPTLALSCSLDRLNPY